MLGIELGKKLKSKMMSGSAWSDTWVWPLAKRAHSMNISNGAHDFHKPLEAAQLRVREAAMRKVAVHFHLAIRDLHVRPESLLPLGGLKR